MFPTRLEKTLAAGLISELTYLDSGGQNEWMAFADCLQRKAQHIIHHIIHTVRAICACALGHLAGNECHPFLNAASQAAVTLLTHFIQNVASHLKEVMICSSCACKHAQ